MAAFAVPAVEAVAAEEEEDLRASVSHWEMLEPAVREGEEEWAASRPRGVVWEED